MIISHRHKFIFIKTRKTAGTSIETFLSAQCGPEDVVTRITPPEEAHHPRNFQGVFNPLRELSVSIADHPYRPDARRLWGQVIKRTKFYNHMTAVSVRARISPHIWESYFKFCVERDPFDKVMSSYHMQMRRGTITTFEDMIGSPLMPKDWEKYTAPGEGIIVDRVLRYEDLNAELGSVFEQLGLEYSGSLTTRAKGNYRAAKNDFTFDDAQKAKLRTIFADEIATLNY